jgi:hypothetical protein
MTLPKSYLLSGKNVEAILTAILGAQAPSKFTIKFLESLDFKSNGDRLIVGVLKSLGFLTESGEPTERYHRYLDQTQAELVLAEGIRDAYADLFQVNVNAHTMSKSEVLNKLKTLSQGQYSESVLDKMALTFVSLCKHGDFSKKPTTPTSNPSDDVPAAESNLSEERESPEPRSYADLNNGIGALKYNIELVLPESRDPKVYDALFRSLKEHLL